jgi:ornithine decarboxylase
LLTRTRKSSVTRSFIDPFTAPEIKRLVSEFGSPLLIIDCQRVREQYRKLHKALPGVDLHYALKPLPHPAVGMNSNFSFGRSGGLRMLERSGSSISP